MIAATLLAGLQRCVAARVLSGEDGTPYARDFGGLRTVVPEAVVCVRSEEETSAVLRLLRGAGVPVTLRGSGFSANGRALGSGVVVVQDAAGADVVIRDDEVEVAARTRWSAVVEKLQTRLLMPPVLTYSLETTVGGTLSAGGYGPASVRHGAQVDHVRRLRLILPDGEARWCDPGDDLFRFALGGLGTIGAIERVVMSTVPFRPLVRLEEGSWSDVDSCDVFFADDGRITAGYDVVAADLFRDAFGETIPRARLHAAGPPREDGYVHLWCDYFLPAASLRTFLALPFDRRGLDRVHVLAIAPGRNARAYAPLADFTRERYFGVGVFYAVPRGDAQAIADARAAQRALLAECLRLGGRPYLAGAHEIGDLAAIFGEEHLALERLRARLDPDRLFNYATGGSSSPPG